MWRPTWTRSSLAFTVAATALSLAIWVEDGDRSYIEASPSAVVSSITLTASQDTWVDEVLPDANLGALPLADAGRPDQRVTGNQQTLLFFDFAGVPQGATVLTATLELWQESFSGPGAIRDPARNHWHRVGRDISHLEHQARH